MLGQRLRRWPNIEPTLDKCTMFERKSSCPANQDICMTFMKCRPSVFDVGPTLHKVIQMFCVYWVTIQTWGSSSFQIPAVIQSVCLQVGDQVGAKDKGFELLPHRCRSSIMNLLWFVNLLLMRLWVWNAYLVLLWNRALAYSRTPLPSGGPLSREFWQLTTPLSNWEATGYKLYRPKHDYFYPTANKCNSVIWGNRSNVIWCV